MHAKLHRQAAGFDMLCAHCDISLMLRRRAHLVSVGINVEVAHLDATRREGVVAHLQHK